MDRTKKLKINTISSLTVRISIFISGLILPRLVLVYYGSEINGLTHSIAQMLSIITFLDMGVSAVVQSSLYKPLAMGDNKKISEVLTSAKNYFRKIAYFLIAYILILTIFYPTLVDQSVGYLATALLIITISISTFSQYYFGIVNELLLNADQKGYIQLFSETIVVILNTIMRIFLITNGFSIQAVQLLSSVIYVFRTLYLSYYVNKNYNISMNLKLDKEPLSQKWNGFAQHIAYTITTSTDIVLLSFFSSLENVSIYAVYSMIIKGVNLVITALTEGLKSFIGSLLAEEEIKLFSEYFLKIEWLIHTLVVYLYGMTLFLIVPFVMIYTQGIKDTNYYAPIFAFVLVLSQMAYSIRTPYQQIILGAGHFKQTQMSSFIEVFINLGVSLMLVNHFGLIGVSVGSLLAISYRTIYLIIYLSKNIIHRSVKVFLKHIFVDSLSFCVMFIVSLVINITSTSFIEWILHAVLLGIIFLIIILIVNFTFYREFTITFYRKIFKRPLK